MRPIGDMTRRRLLCLSAMFFAIPAVLMPLAGRSSFEANAQRVGFAGRFGVQPAAVTALRTYPQLGFVRDPFALPQHLLARDVTGMHVVQGASTGIRIPGAGVRVTAIVEGADARALVEEDGSVRVIRAGDILGGSIVRAILRNGVRLGNGTFIGIADGPR